MVLILLENYFCTNCSNFQIQFVILGVTEVFQTSRLLQTVLFLTDSVLHVLFAYFDESMASIVGYEPQRTWNTVGLTPIQIKNEFITVPKGSDLLYYTNGSHKFLLKFCVDEVSVGRGAINMRRTKRGKSSSLGMTKAPQVNIPRILKHLSLGMP